MPDLAALTHAFTIGGTKNGALFGEALVLTRPMPHFRWHMKQRGAVLAKGRLLGLQFQALLEDGLYFDLARRANEAGLPAPGRCRGPGISLPGGLPSNQQFPVLPNETVAKLQEMGYEFETDHPVDANHTCIRLVTSWSHAGDGGGGLPQGPGRVLNIQGTAKQAVPFCVVLPALLAHGSCQTLSYFCSISA
ncbi:hypothetical protein [Oscillibacter sp.]|uniref:hypothetical protein n=1 Tax=Oscillibacter sp. TaxID=1945593 RepID=UPI00338E9EC6